jgi:hypothetical protein
MLELFDCFDTQELMEEPDAYIQLNFHDDDTMTDEEIAVLEGTQAEIGEEETGWIIASWTHPHLDNIPQGRFIVTYRWYSEMDRRVAIIHGDMLEAKENAIKCANGECDDDCPCRVTEREMERRRQMPDFLSDSDDDDDYTVYSSDGHYQTGTASQSIIRATPPSRRERRAKNGAGKASTRQELTEIAVRSRTRYAAKHPTNVQQALGLSRGILQHTDMINTVASVYANPHILE